MATNIIDDTASETLGRHIEQLRERVTALRREVGDPSAALGSFLRDRYAHDSLVRARQEYRLDRSMSLNEDEMADDGW